MENVFLPADTNLATSSPEMCSVVELFIPSQADEELAGPSAVLLPDTGSSSQGSAGCLPAAAAGYRQTVDSRGG